jgi:hypothetical protein
MLCYKYSSYFLRKLSFTAAKNEAFFLIAGLRVRFSTLGRNILCFQIASKKKL